MPYRYYQSMGLIRKAIFYGTAATGTPLVRRNSSAEAAAIEQRRLMQEQNDILSQIADSDDGDSDDIPPEWCDENGIPLPGYFKARMAAIAAEDEAKTAAARSAQSAEMNNKAANAVADFYKNLGKPFGVPEESGTSPQPIRAESVDSGNDVKDSNGSTSGTLANQLREAKSLFDEGLINADEYAALRLKVLGL